VELLVRLMIEPKDEGADPATVLEVVDVVVDELAIGTKANPDIPWRVVGVVPESELIARRVFSSDGVGTGEEVQ
jgi:hypothetical protein